MRLADPNWCKRREGEPQPKVERCPKCGIARAVLHAVGCDEKACGFDRLNDPNWCKRLEAEIRRLRLELIVARDRLEHAERKLAGEWPYDDDRLADPNWCKRL
jgi:hypothetical protein